MNENPSRVEHLVCDSKQSFLASERLSFIERRVLNPAFAA